MDLLNLIVGLIMISIGFLVKSTPNLIAGYNAMSKEKKKNVDIEGLTTFLRNGFIPSKTIYGDNTIKFSGMYGFEIGIGEIEDVELSDKLPTITSRSNGFSFGNIKKGFFKLDEFGKSRLLIHSDLAPYLIMTKNSGDKIIINFKDKIETEETYNKIKIMINK